MKFFGVCWKSWGLPRYTSGVTLTLLPNVPPNSLFFLSLGQTHTGIGNVSRVSRPLLFVFPSITPESKDCYAGLKMRKQFHRGWVTCEGRSISNQFSQDCQFPGSQVPIVPLTWLPVKKRKSSTELD